MCASPLGIPGRCGRGWAGLFGAGVALGGFGFSGVVGKLIGLSGQVS